jgi:hypothetical protein
MRFAFWGSLALGLPLLAFCPVRADDQADMKVVVDKAIKAAGGEAKLKKLKAMTWKAKGTFTEGNRDIGLTIDASIQGTKQAKLDLSADVNGNTVTINLVVNSDKGWVKHPKLNGGVENLPKEILAFLKNDFYALRLAQMLVALKDKDCKLSALGEVKIDDKPAVGIKVTRKGQAEVDVYFDQKTSLPVKCTIKGKEDANGQERTHEFFFSEFKKAGGVQHFTKILFKRDDKKMIEVELSDIETVDKHDDGVFAKPD